MNGTKTTPSIAPRHPLSPADKAAHRAAEYRRGDSDPHMDEALRRVQMDLAYDLRDRQFAETLAAEIAAGVA